MKGSVDQELAGTLRSLEIALRERAEARAEVVRLRGLLQQSETEWSAEARRLRAALKDECQLR